MSGKERQVTDILTDEVCEMTSCGNCCIDLEPNHEWIPHVAHEITAIFQPAQKDTRSRRERALDAEFERMGVKPRIYHITKDMDPYFTGITMATMNILTKQEAKQLIQQTIQKATQHSFYQPATQVLKGLEAVGEYGIAICDHSDIFSKRYGRMKAKGRFMQHLLGEQNKCRL